ncbi:MAG: sigma-54-dependent Fis family transcriptional regulator [Acidobacteria bacterium]|nr:sigma-54-dependent Fis family transcriptional regulator [Acidobacteriota bacterium]
MDFRASIAVVTRSERMNAILSRIDTIAQSDTSVLLVGETGVGKELFADYIHRTSPRASRPLIKIALSAMPHDLLEAELFGHERGAFTSAHAEKPGLFELADTGTLFLDDIDDVPPAVQAKLLRVLESRQVMRVGGRETLPIDVRLISASKVDLKELVSRQLFRADLYYRINVCPVDIPPLRERREDVPLLMQHFLKRFVPDRTFAISEAAERMLLAYNWPGNVRELRNVAQQIALFANGTVEPKHLPAELRDGHPVELLVRACTRCLVDASLSYNDVVLCLETNMLRQALAESGGNRTQAARMLGLSLSTLRDKLKKFGLEQGPEVDRRV